MPKRKNRVAEVVGDKPKISKYGKKLAARAAYAKEESASTPAPAATPPRAAIAPPSVQVRGRVTAVVESVQIQRGCAFLVTEDGHKIYMGMRLFWNKFPERDCEAGMVLDCHVGDGTRGKYPPVRQIYSAEMPSLVG